MTPNDERVQVQRSAKRVVITLVAIVKAVIEYRRGAGVDLGHIVILIVGIILVITFPNWGWGLIN